MKSPFSSHHCFFFVGGGGFLWSLSESYFENLCSIFSEFLLTPWLLLLPPHIFLALELSGASFGFDELHNAEYFICSHLPEAICYPEDNNRQYNINYKICFQFRKYHHINYFIWYSKQLHELN